MAYDLEKEKREAIDAGNRAYSIFSILEADTPTIFSLAFSRVNP